MALTSGTRLGPYEILGAIGAGGMGEVYRARDPRLGRDVAIKVLPVAFSTDADRLRRLEQEARAAAALNHPNILTVHEIGTHDGQSYVVSELLDGQTLRDALGHGALPVTQAIEYAMQMCRGLAAAYEKGIVHRDLKPENVFVTNDGRIKILDFGLAKLTEAAVAGAGATMTATHPGETSPGVVMGTIGYMSPEQVRGQAVDHRSDIFSFGAVLYEMLSGARAFTGGTPADTISAILGTDPPELTLGRGTISSGLERIVRHCLEKLPGRRFQSATDVAFALDAVSTTRSDASLSGIPSVIAPRWTATAWRVAAIVALGLAVGAIGFFVGTRRSTGSAPRMTRLTFERGTINSARFAPDGQTVVYGAAWHGQPTRIFQTRLGSPESIPLPLPDADVLAIAPSGEMAIALNRRFHSWVSSGVLARAPLVGGSPREIVETISEADWSPKGDELAVVRRVSGKDRLEYPLGHVLYETTGYLSHLRLSPSGDVIAFLDHPVYDDNRGFVSLVTTAGERKRLTKDWSSAQGLAWSPDGRDMWYTATDGGRDTLRAVTRSGADREVWAAPADLTVLDASSDGRVLMTANSLYAESRWFGPGESEERDISWFAWSMAHDLSTDGHAVLFNRYDEGAGLDYQMGLRRIEAAGTVLLGTGQATLLSPDGKWALGLTYSTPGLFALPTGTGERRTLTTPGFSYSTGGWFPDGTRILFIAEHEREPAAAYVQDLTGGAPRKVASRIPQLEPNFGTSVSPDGQWFFGWQASGPPVIVPIEGGEPRALANLTENDVPRRWTADGRGLIVARRAPDLTKATIARYELATGRLDPLRTITLADTSGLRRFDLLVSPDGRTVVYNLVRYLTDLYLVEGLK